MHQLDPQLRDDLRDRRLGRRIDPRQADGREQPDGEAQALVDYLLSQEGQTYFVEQTYEYPLVEGIDAPAGLPSLEELDAPDIDLNDLDDLQRTIEMITEAGLL